MQKSYVPPKEFTLTIIEINSMCNFRNISMFLFPLKWIILKKYCMSSLKVQKILKGENKLFETKMQKQCLHNFLLFAYICDLLRKIDMICRDF